MEDSGNGPSRQQAERVPRHGNRRNGWLVDRDRQRSNYASTASAGWPCGGMGVTSTAAGHCPADAHHRGPASLSRPSRRSRRVPRGAGMTYTNIGPAKACACLCTQGEVPAEMHTDLARTHRAEG